MSPERKNAIRRSWQLVVPIAGEAMAMFYDRLFELDPSLEPLFAAADPADQRKKLAQALDAVVASLDDLERIVPHLEELGRRHVDYGVADAHYDTVGAALIWTLRQGLGAAFTADIEAAWVEAYGLVAGTMRAAAAEVARVEDTAA